MSARTGVVAVMQPYFYPYAGYYRLLALAETFVLLDDVQFTRRGRIHRCEVPAPDGADAPRWLTLPLAHQPRSVLIRDLAFAADARAALDARLAGLPWLGQARGPLADGLKAQLAGALTTPLGFVEAGLRFVADALALPARIVRSSSLALDPRLSGQGRILALIEALGGRTYVNLAGGRSLYSAADFALRGLRLRFLQPYAGRFPYMLPALAEEDAAALRADVLQTARLAGDGGQRDQP